MSLLAFASGMSACYLSHGRGGSNDAGHDGGATGARDAGARDGGPTVMRHDAGRRDAGRSDGGRDGGPPIRLPCEDPIGVDLLLVLDDSGSIRPREPLVRDRLERIVYRLLQPPDLDADGFEDWPRVVDLHVGAVATSVLGTNFCLHATDGVLLTVPSPEGVCEDVYPSHLRYREGDTSPSALADDVGCISFGPRPGCSVEQPLEAMAKALLPVDSPFEHIAGRARGDVENAGFLRPDSVLVVLILADEDDCSVLDPRVFVVPDAGLPDGGGRGRDAGVAARGCLASPAEYLFSVERYAAVLRHLRPEHPERIIIGIIAAIEADLVITDPLGQEIRGCRDPASYPRRLVDLARAFPTQSVIGSVCDLGEMRLVEALAERVTSASCGD